MAANAMVQRRISAPDERPQWAGLDQGQPFVVAEECRDATEATMYLGRNPSGIGTTPSVLLRRRGHCLVRLAFEAADRDVGKHVASASVT